MAVQVNAPRREQKKDDTDNLFKIGGAVLGGIYGGPAGAMTGAQLGGLAGGMLQGPGDSGDGGQNIVEASAMDRRMNAIDNSNLGQLRQSINSLQYVKDPEVRMALAKPLLKAQYLAEREEA